jgi:uncharacterized protein YkwD
VIEAVTILPSPATANDALTCGYDGFVGGEDASEIQWMLNGEAVGSGDVLEDGFVKDDEVSCTVTPSNGNKFGEPVTATVVIENAPPILASVTLSPTAPTAMDDVFCDHGDATDVDGDGGFAYTYAWSVNGTRIGASQDSLSAGEVERDDVVQCHVSPTDGVSVGAEVDSQEVTVVNSAPSISGLAIDPPSPLVEDTLMCDYTAFVDGDGDPDQSTLSWTINSVAAGTGPSLGSGFEEGDQVTCKVVPFDGIEEGEAVSVTVVILGLDECDDDGDGYWPVSSAGFECEVLDETNYYRSTGYNCDSKGKFPATSPLTMQFQLRKAARYHSEWMADTGTFSHDSPGGPYGDDFVDRITWAGYSGWSRVGENIAAGYTSPVDVVKGWMESDGHCANIMNDDFNEIGIGHHYDSGSTYGHWWSQEFGKR